MGLIYTEIVGITVEKEKTGGTVENVEHEGDLDRKKHNSNIYM